MSGRPMSSTTASGAAAATSARASSPPRRARVVAAEHERAAQGVPQRAVVVDDQDPHGAHCGGRGAFFGHSYAVLTLLLHAPQGSPHANPGKDHRSSSSAARWGSPRSAYGLGTRRAAARPSGRRADNGRDSRAARRPASGRGASSRLPGPGREARRERQRAAKRPSATSTRARRATAATTSRPRWPRRSGFGRQGDRRVRELHTAQGPLRRPARRSVERGRRQGEGGARQAEGRQPRQPGRLRPGARRRARRGHDAMCAGRSSRSRAPTRRPHAPAITQCRCANCASALGVNRADLARRCARCAPARRTAGSITPRRSPSSWPTASTSRPTTWRRRSNSPPRPIPHDHGDRPGPGGRGPGAGYLRPGARTGPGPAADGRLMRIVRASPLRT